jgi:hypothetical protein
MITYRFGNHTGRGSERESCVYAQATSGTYTEANYGIKAMKPKHNPDLPHWWEIHVPRPE